MKEYKHKISFAAKILPIDSEKREKVVSFASKNSNLSKLIPKEVNLTQNIGFQLFEAEAFVANKLNLNSDGVKTAEAIKLKESLPLGFIDLEHKREKLVGVIADSTYIDYETGKELSEAQIKDMTEPFSVAITGIIWRAANPEIADAIQNINNKESNLKDEVFASWEVCFDNFDLLVIDKDKFDFIEGKLITDKSEIDKLSKKLQCYGGNGLTDEGKKIGRIPIDDVVGLGIGLVQNPAGQVSPIAVNDKIESSASINLSESLIEKLKSLPETGMGYQICDIEMEDGSIIANISIHNCSILSKELNINEIKDIKLSESKADIIINKDVILKELKNVTKEEWEMVWPSNDKNQQNNEKSENKISQAAKPVVNDTDNILPNKMKIEKFEQLTDENLKEVKSVAELKEIFASSAKDLLDNKIKEISKDYTDKLSEKDIAIKAAQDAQANLDKSVKELNDKLSKASQDLEKLQNESKQREQLEAFSARMGTIEEGFDLDDKQKEIVANKVKTLGNDEEFNKYLAEIEVLLAAKKKASKKNDKKDPDNDGDDDSSKKGDTDKDFAGKDKKEAKASVDDKDAIDAALKNGEKKDGIIPNVATGAETLTERAKKAFGLDGWTVVNKRKNRN